MRAAAVLDPRIKSGDDAVPAWPLRRCGNRGANGSVMPAFAAMTLHEHRALLWTASVPARIVVCLRARTRAVQCARFIA
jgi:hypothetical protein